MSYIHLLFPDQGLCEITGVLMCSLVDMRFSQPAQDDDQIEHVTSADTLFGDCDVGMIVLCVQVLHRDDGKGDSDEEQREYAIRDVLLPHHQLHPIDRTRFLISLQSFAAVQPIG